MLVQNELIIAVVNKAIISTDYNIHNDVHKQHEFRQKTILADKSLTKDEKTEAMKMLSILYDERKILLNEGTKRICKDCSKECLATSYCEYCIRNYLKANFSNWSSGNDDIDNLI
jgi:hypothetical protein